VSERRVLLGIATGGSPTQPFLDSLGKLRLPAGVGALERSVAFGNYIPAQREIIMADALDGNFDYLFFVDDDIVLPEDALERLTETIESDPQTAVVGGLYYSRDSVRPVTVGGWDSTDTTTSFIPAFTRVSTDEVDGIGFGCALLRVATARTFVPPYFPAHVYLERRSRVARQCDEDFCYCERVRKAGYRVRLDARVRCGHYDRHRGIAFPEEWESDELTSVPRMIVAGVERPALVPLDDSAPRATEHHAVADLVYISVEA
jgi:GT2 family glycosyltransferase